MCNLSEIIEEEAMRKTSERIARSVFKNGASFELVKNSIKDLTEEELLEIYHEVHPE